MNIELIGLSKRDKRIYEALLTMPDSSIRNIAEQTGVNRGSVYESIKALRSAGLVTYVDIGKQTRYSAQDPEVLHELINDRRRELSEMHNDVDSFIKAVGSTRESAGVFQFASFYDGDEGLAAILRDILTTARRDGFSEYYSISSPRVSEYLYNSFRNFTRERIKQGLTVKIIGLGKPLTKEADLAERRLMPGGGMDEGCYTLIYGSKVAIATIDKYKHTSGIIIDNLGITRVQRSLFEAMWREL